MAETNLYFHIPFCRRRCGYCDFNTYAGFSHAIPAYVKALCNEVEVVSKWQKRKSLIKTIFFGGGTPSFLTINQFSEILSEIRNSFNLDQDIEITLEANPGTVSADYLNSLHQLGFTRISFGMQSAHPHDLIMLDRQHKFEDVVNSVLWSQTAGFKHINLDLIFAIPGQTLERWQEALRLAAGFPVDHLSLYALTIEEGTPLAKWNKRGILDIIDDDLAAEMYLCADEILKQAGFSQYEISNWARATKDNPEARCRHNLNTWRYQPYFGFGAGAHGFIGHQRTTNVGPIPAYILKMDSPKGDWPAAEEVELLDEWDEMQEWMMVGLRLTEEGVSKQAFLTRFGFSFEQVFSRQIEWCFERGLLEIIPNDEDRMRLSPRGRLLGNQVFMQFVGNDPPELVQKNQ
ncbi:MAG: radical SAM family heme chaperone HemW [Anaerolineaceae bacterium]